MRAHKGYTFSCGFEAPSKRDALRDRQTKLKKSECQQGKEAGVRMRAHANRTIAGCWPQSGLLLLQKDPASTKENIDLAGEETVNQVGPFSHHSFIIECTMKGQSVYQSVSLF